MFEVVQEVVADASNRDERIQQTLRTSFPDSSIITIAHRLRMLAPIEIPVRCSC